VRAALQLTATTFGTSYGVLRARLQRAAGERLTLALGALLVFVIATGTTYWTFQQCDCIERQYDDAYITFRYAHNLATGRGLVFNPGDATDSASSFLYTILLAALELLGFRNLPRVAAFIGIGGAGVIAALVYCACLERTRRPLLAAALGVLAALHGLVSGWAVSGMETIFYSALVIALLYRLFIRRAFGWVEAVLCIAVLLTRFEGVLLAAAWAGVGAYRFFYPDALGRRRVVQLVAAVSGAFGVFLLLKYALYGTFIPHAFALKTITELYAPNPRALWDVWRADALLWLCLGAAGLLTLPRSWESVGLMFYVVASLVSLVEGPFADYARYSVHMLPVAAVLASVPLSRLTHHFMPVTLAVVSVLGYDTYNSLASRRDAMQAGAGHEKCRTEVGEYLERALAPGTLVLSSDIGVIAYAAPSIRFVDAVGLTSKDVLHARMEGQNVDSVLFEQRPVYIADTCGGKCTRSSEFSAYNWLSHETYWRTPLPRERYMSQLQHGKLLHRCRSPDGLFFGVSKFDLATR
jgi:arabinofuranosyltransferase